jgi:hypothetical protein
MALSNTQFRLAAAGHVYVAPLGSPVPVDVSTAWNAAWTEMGYVDDSGIGVTPKLNFVEMNSWQSALPTKELIQSAELSLAFNLQQTNLYNLGLYWFGNTFATAGGINTMTASTDPTTDERMLGIEWTDVASSITSRLIIPRGMVTDRTKMDINRKTAQVFGITFMALDSAGTLFYLLDNNAAD